MKTGNLFKARTMLNSLPDASLDEVLTAAHRDRNFSRFYIEAKRIAKGDTTEMQKVFILTYASLKSIQMQVKDESVVKQIDDLLTNLNEFASKYGPRFTSEGFTLALLMGLLSFFFGAVPVLGGFIAVAGASGIMLFLFGIFLYVVRIVLNTYFNIKGMK